jgi:hypothetical protein
MDYSAGMGACKECLVTSSRCLRWIVDYLDLVTQSDWFEGEGNSLFTDNRPSLGTERCLGALGHFEL